MFVSYATYIDPTDPFSLVRPEENKGYVVKLLSFSANLGDIIEVQKMSGSCFVRIKSLLAKVSGSWLCAFEFVDEEGNLLPKPEYKPRRRRFEQPLQDFLGDGYNPDRH